jgi:hypothetical protein
MPLNINERHSAARSQSDNYLCPAEVLTLLIETIPLLSKGKDGVLLFFRSCGAPERVLADLRDRLRRDKNSVSKYEIARTVLTRLSEAGDGGLGPLRAVLKQVTDFEDFSVCWESDRHKAKGLVQSVRESVERRDAFTRMKQERDAERAERLAPIREAAAERERLHDQRNVLRHGLAALFSWTGTPQGRGTALERILNGLCASERITIRESFRVVDGDTGTVAEQIDGVIELDGATYLVEMRWRDKPLGVEEVSRHLVRVYGRGEARGIIISASRFTGPAIDEVKRTLTQRVFVLCELEEVILMLERGDSIAELLREKVHAAVVDRNPLYRSA